jgi:hypothetical protein
MDLFHIPFITSELTGLFAGTPLIVDAPQSYGKKGLGNGMIFIMCWNSCLLLTNVRLPLFFCQNGVLH